MNKKKIAFAILTLAVFALPFVTMAALPTPTVTGGGTGVTLDEVQLRIEQVARFLIIISIIVAVIVIIWGGILYMWSRGDDKKAGDAKNTIKNGIIGALVVLAVGVILQTLAGLVTRSFFG